MRLWHTTPRYNLFSIQNDGLRTVYSQGKIPAVWLHTEEKTSWAFLHCVKRHGGRVEDVVTIEVEVPDDDLRRSAVDGLFYTKKDVNQSLILSIKEFRVVSQSPLEDC